MKVQIGADPHVINVVDAECRTSRLPSAVRPRIGLRHLGDRMSTLLHVYLLATAAVGALLLATIAVQAGSRAVRRTLRPTTR